jgi:3'(2'), 5'-bisphosphate nucleotidase
MKMQFDLDPFFAPSNRLVDEITTLVSRAAAAILAISPSGAAERIKPDLSPVTAADEAAQSVILEGLSRLLPDIPIISEEASGPTPILEPGAPFVLVDPLDGTREFMAGRDEFTVNVALVRQGVPVFGCIAAPVFGLIWRGIVGQGAERLELPAGADASACRSKTTIRTRKLPERGVVVAVSRSHFDPRTEHFLAQFPQAERIACGSSLKFCRVAEGSVDLYPRLAPTHEWDVAAGHAIVAAAGGLVASASGEPLAYGQSTNDFRISDFVAFGDPTAVDRVSRLTS